MNKYVSQKDSVENMVMILGLHLIFFLSSFFLAQNLQLFFSLPLFIVMSLVHHKFLGEFIHEGTHYHLHKSKIANEYISNYLISLL